MRTQVYLYDPFHRDIEWITQEVIEDYAGSMLRGLRAGELCIQKWARADATKMKMMAELLNGHPDISILQDELIDEFGEERFIGKARSREFHIKELEARIEYETDGRIAAALIQQLRELRGWTLKPAEAGSIVNIQNNVGAQPKIVIDPNDAREAERVVMSVFASL